MESDDLQDLDQLISRHLDGDLTSDEGQQLSQVVVRDRAQAQRLMRMSILNNQLRTLLNLDRDSSSKKTSVVLAPRFSVLGVPWRTGAMLLGLLIISGLVSWVSSKSAQNPKAIPQSVAEDGSFHGLSSVQLESGTVKLKIPNVGFVTVDGPANFEMLSKNRARLEKGRIRMRVTEESGRGFVVETPDGEITDLGTEFGVDVRKGQSSVLAVFEGLVDLNVAGQSAASQRTERLVGGDGIRFNRGGKIDRLNFVRKDEEGTFACAGDAPAISADAPLIADVYDNLPASSTKRFYQIVPKGMGEDALAYVDRLEHNWNGLSSLGMPPYLVGADYVKTFNEDKRQENFQLTIVVNRPALIFVLLDKRVQAPPWLTAEFSRSYEMLGLDCGRWNMEKEVGNMPAGVGPGNSIDTEMTIWMREVKQPGPVVLGRNGINKKAPHLAGMYGIVAVEMSKVRKIEHVRALQTKGVQAEK